METLATQKRKTLSWIFWLKQKLLVNGKDYLEVTAEGKFYLGVTVALGVGALLSSNNVLYLLDSILLSSLAISGIVSDRIITGIKLEVFPRQALANQPCEDQIKVTNLRRYRLFFIKIYEISNQGTQCIAEIPELDAHSTVWVQSRAIYQTRGTHEVIKYSIGTYYPFGLALKKVPHSISFERTVWPQRTKVTHLQDDTRESQKHQRWGSQITAGEVKEYQIGEDSRNIVWTISSKFEEDFYIRPRRAAREKRELVLNLKNYDVNDFENQISEIATTFYNSSETETELSLRVLGSSGQIHIIDRSHAIDYLSKAQREYTS